MAKKRNLKKGIKNICCNAAAECLMAIECVDGLDTEVMDQIINKIAGLEESTMSHLSFVFDKSPRDFANRHEFKLAKEAYFAKAYRTLLEEFNKATQQIIKEMNAALPAAQKEANKKAVNGLA